MILSIRESKKKRKPLPNPWKRNRDYDGANYVDVLREYEKRKSRLESIVRFASTNIKFWISPKGEFFSWPCNSYESSPHHNAMLKNFAKGYFSGDPLRNSAEVAAAEWDGWVDGGNMNGKFYIRTHPEDAIDKLKAVPPEYRKSDYIEFESSGEEASAWGQDVLEATEKYLRKDRVTASIKLSSRDAVEDTIKYWDKAKNKDFSKYWRLLRKKKGKKS